MKTDSIHLSAVIRLYKRFQKRGDSALEYRTYLLILRMQRSPATFQRMALHTATLRWRFRLRKKARAARLIDDVRALTPDQIDQKEVSDSLIIPIRFQVMYGNAYRQ